MTDWLALSDREPLGPADPAPLAQALFVLEFRLPLYGPTVLLQHQTADGRAFSVFHDPDAGPTVLLRADKRLIRCRLAQSLPPDRAGIARLSLALTATAWQLSFQALDHGPALTAQGADPRPFDIALFRQMTDRMSGAHRHASVLWFGLTRAAHLPKSAPWIGPNTPIETPRGPVLAQALQPGMQVLTLDHGPLPVTSVAHMTLPAAGSFAPVVLRRPFFAKDRDLLVSADQHLLISGASVEYLTGEEEVLVPAGALADGRVAVRDNRRAVTRCVALDLGRPALVMADGCVLLSVPPNSAAHPLPRRALQDWEMLPLLSLLGRTSLRPAA